MSRLREASSTDPVLTEAARLVRAAAPEAPSAAAQARVWAALQQPRVRARRKGLLALRPALALGVLSLLGALAGATVLRGWQRHMQPTITAPPAPTAHHKHGRRAEAPVEVPAVPVVELPAVVEPAALQAPPAPTPSTTAPVVPERARTEHPSHVVPAPTQAPPPSVPPSPAPPLVAAPSDPSTALLQNAVRALRHEHDAGGAAALADQYLDRYPDGDLLEEAMAIAMQAHDQLGDAQARAMSARYLSRFPAGRFRREALHAK